MANTEENSWQEIREWLTLLVIFVASVTSIGLWIAQLQANKTGIQAVIQANRPWLSVSVELGRFTRDARGLWYPIDFKLRNTGTSPALNLSEGSKTFPIRWAGFNLPDEEKAVCTTIKNNPGIPGNAVFHDTDLSFPLLIAGPISPEELATVPASAPFFTLLVIVCFKYTYFGGNGTTALPVTVLIDINPAALHVGDAIPADKIHIVPQIGLQAD